MWQSNLFSSLGKIAKNPAWALIAAFGTYFCMYGFRKPYTAATYSETFFFGIDYKFLLIIAQTCGYVVAKWAGIKIVSEIRPNQRIKLLIGLIIFAECMLFLFGIVPRPWNMFCLFLNGLPLGIVFGLILGFLEGRKNTEALIAGLCASFIVSDGVSKSVGTLLLNYHIPENWMPFFAGLIFLLPTMLFIGMLSLVPPPAASDIANRSIRQPMFSEARKAFFKKYAGGLIGITVIYLFITLLRSIRADFAPELWKGMGYLQTPVLFTQSELLVSFGVILIIGLAVCIGNHYHAFRFSLFTCLSGFLIILFSVFAFEKNINSFAFMVLLGLGIYIPYVAVHAVIFERLIAITKERANIGFLMYLVDSVGYTGYIILMVFRYATPPGVSILSIFLKICIKLGITGFLVVLYCNWYFKIKFSKNEPIHTQLSTW